MKVLNFGSMNVDYVYRVDRFLQPGETKSAISRVVTPGGKGLNQSIALARAGVPVCHAGCLGESGESLKQLFQENGVDTTHLKTVEEMQGHTIIQVTDAGENCILLFGGSNQCVTPEQIDEVFSAFGQGDYLILQNEVNLLPLIVDKAYERGMRIVLNPSPYDEKLEAVDFGKLTWLLVNEVEAAQLSGCPEPEAAWEKLHASYPSLHVLITLGSAGSIAYRPAPEGLEIARQEAFSVKAVDTTAAGDTFTGYFISGLLEGLPLADCMRLASMASAISVTRPGASASIPLRSEVEEALKEQA